MSGRRFLTGAPGLGAGLSLTLARRMEARPQIRVTGFELLPVRATERTVWLIVRLRTDAGLSGIGEASDVIMPDVKHCGGLLELTRIAAMAEADEVAVSPHNPSGPVSTAASVQICAVLKNFRNLECQWGEVAWRADLLEPPEQFEQGTIRVPERPGFGVELNDGVLRAHLM